MDLRQQHLLVNGTSGSTSNEVDIKARYYNTSTGEWSATYSASSYIDKTPPVLNRVHISTSKTEPGTCVLDKIDYSSDGRSPIKEIRIYSWSTTDGLAGAVQGGKPYAVNANRNSCGTLL